MREFEKKISVIVPVCNAERYVARCIDSILSSPLEDIEVIAVADGSLDRSLEILMMYKDPRLKVFSKRSEGMFRTWKYGVERASGEYIVFVDADDYVSPALFETVESLLRLRDYDLIQHGWVEVYERSARKTCGSLDIPQGEYLGEELRRVKDGYLFGGQVKQRMFPLALYGKVFRAELFCSLLPALLEDISAFAGESICIPYLSKMQSLYFLSDHLYFRRKEERSVVNQARALVDAKTLDGFLRANEERFSLPEDALDRWYYSFHLNVLEGAVRGKNDELAKRILGEKKFGALFAKYRRGLCGALLQKKLFPLARLSLKGRDAVLGARGAIASVFRKN